MNTESREHLSSLMDGEISSETGRFLVRRLGADNGLREVWARYHLIRDCLRHQDGNYVQKDLSGRVNLALSAEPPVKSAFHFANRWFKPLVGAAMAASVAVVAVLAVSTGPLSAPEQDAAIPDMSTVAEAARLESFTSPNITAATQRSQPVNLSGRSAPANVRMNTYLLRHYQVAGDAGGRGFVSFVPIVVTQASGSAEPVTQAEDEDGEAGFR